MQWGTGLVLLAALVHITYAAREGKGCKYGKGEGYVKGECDAATGTRTTTMVLKKGEGCEPTKTFTRPCGGGRNDGGGCKYEWDDEADSAECDPTTRRRTVTMHLIEGDPEECEETKTSLRKCTFDGGAHVTVKSTKGNSKKGKKGNKKNRRNGKKGRKGEKDRNGMDDKRVEENGCVYEYGVGTTEGDCVVQEDGLEKKNVTLVLTDGDKESCNPTKTIIMPCDNHFGGCKYRKAKEETPSTCDPVTRERTLTLVLSMENAECPQTKTITKPCVPEGCVYSDGEWSECQPGDTDSTRVDTLVTSPEGVNCEPTIQKKRSCRSLANKQAKKEQRKQGRKAQKKEQKASEKEERKEKKKQERKERKEQRKERRGQKNKRGQQQNQEGQS